MGKTENGGSFCQKVSKRGAQLSQKPYLNMLRTA